MDFTDEQLERYSRHLVLKEVGGAGQVALLNARVLVIGAGGLGAPLLMYLAAAGVGTIGIIDDDHVELSNLQRQIIHRTQDIGVRKTASAAKRINNLNSDVKLELHPTRLTPENAEDLIGSFDIIADGCDNFETRHLVNDACVKLGKTLVSAALGPYEGQIATFKPHANSDYPCYRCFLPHTPGEDEQRTCADTGILGAVAGVVGSLQALEILKEILGIGESLAGKIMLFDALAMTSRIIGLPKDISCRTCGSGEGTP
ncbi:molybdopterin-synthase adenylyltransferase MoeB [Kordiimonas sp. SCSIO 12610]|uniref:HesA/MoeB/ThiF family protein n=1 Tax=Kordiimonas sp. SCSIO 12610 TaxID=2829597 RepID=UPI002108DE49|nr:molybdopterin-synthase adenylyltransferase MoeB [Kordiimonas sp. SCSIO 12610]UTW55331.1 molybdopterin-synthase adenylyltransferase MoeB [Kordiimonas sp. SCSIO 12610]